MTVASQIPRPSWGSVARDWVLGSMLLSWKCVPLDLTPHPTSQKLRKMVFLEFSSPKHLLAFLDWTAWRADFKQEKNGLAALFGCLNNRLQAWQTAFKKSACRSF